MIITNESNQRPLDELVAVDEDSTPRSVSSFLDTTSVSLGNYSPTNNKLSINLRSQLKLQFPMYQVARELGNKPSRGSPDSLTRCLKAMLFEMGIYDTEGALFTENDPLTGTIKFHFTNSFSFAASVNLTRLCFYNYSSNHVVGTSSEAVLRHELGHAIQEQILGISNHPIRGTIIGSLQGYQWTASAAWEKLYNVRRQKAEAVAGT